MVIYYIEHVYLRHYIYSFWQFFQTLCLFPALHLFRRLEYVILQSIYIFFEQFFNRIQMHSVPTGVFWLMTQIISMCRSKPRICRALLPSFYNKRSFACWYHSITKDGSDMNRPLHFIILTGLLVSIAICAVLSENQMAELLEQPSELGPSILELYLAPFGNKDVGKLNWVVHHVCRNTNPEFFTYSRVWNKRTPLNKRSP